MAQPAPRIRRDHRCHGAHDAVNLDGGGSTTMWTAANGVVNAPSNEQPERGVPSAVLIHLNED